ncbi:MAG: PBP1A family penicillin-binding protein [Thermodesulfovibrionales bacterium]|nr:PBP1A family penicillin-binding protein [Thermodesulfovibrionales bacterium]
MSKKLLSGLIIFSTIAGVIGGFINWTVSDLPNIKLLEEYAPMESSRVYSSDGKVLAELYVERRTFIPSYNIPDFVKKAFISVEDERFYYHPGVDFIGIMRALWKDIKAGGIVEGGSTITQQLARMLFLQPDKSIKRKIKEAALSIKIEQRYTKDEILGMYLNQAYFGTRAYGIEAASQTYFGKTTRDVTLAEAALLASMPKAPSVYSPFRNPEKARDRRTTVLQQMLDQKFITEEQFRQAKQEPLPETPHFRKYDAPYFIETLRQALEIKYGNGLYTEGYKIYSTVNSVMQQAAEEAVRKGAAIVEKRTKPGIEAALLAVDLRTGQIKAMVGGVDFWKNQFNRATQALRQPGSAFKPFVYITAIENGMTSEQMISDTPISFPGARSGQTWRPKNYDGQYHGSVTLKTAMAKSLNVAAIRLAANTGVENIIVMAKKLGIQSTLQPYLPLAIGASDVTLMDMVTAYAAFATGMRTKPQFYEKVLNRDGIVIQEAAIEQEEVLSEKAVNEMKILLRAVVEEGTAKKAKELKRDLYGKTGTTNDYTDAWFVGFDDRLVVGVWVGRDNHTPIGARQTGSSAALPVWIEFMKRVPQQILADQNP